MSNSKKKTIEDIKPQKDESPSHYADRLGIYYTSQVTEKHKKDFGQFFTPIDIARFMASFSMSKNETIKILDPGCGIGILTTALAEVLAATSNVIKNIELVAFETDPDILPLAENCFNYLSAWLNHQEINFTFFLCKNDFILHNSPLLNNSNYVTESYDIVISNPPYFKLPKDDERVKVAKSVIHGQTNIYSIFLLLATKLLKDGGRLIFITPRSFCSGNYFRLFRELFFPMVDITNIHLFNSRKDAFKRDKVLQENIIIAATKRSTFPDNILAEPDTEEAVVTISTSNGINDLDKRRIKKHKYSDLINTSSYQKILHLPASDTDEEVIKVFKNWTGSLSVYDLEISTGPVVDFRSEKMISIRRRKDSVPLIWLHNITPMRTVWPLNNGYKGKSKGQYISNNESSKSRLVENKNYVFLRRFSTKDENRRLIAAPYLKEMPGPQKLGVENHLNYIYHKSRELTNVEVIGIAALLNSKLFDLYFRTFNGNINVSATELRDFPLPSFELIRSLGERATQLHDIPNNININLWVSEIFDLKIDLPENYE